MAISQGSISRGNTGSLINKTNQRILTVLVVEDSPMNQMLLEIMLSRLHMKAVCVDDGRKAMELLQTTRVDLILSDIMMPDMDGFELLAKIRQMQELKGIPVVLMTAGGMISLTDEAVQRGADGFLAQPFSSFDLERVLTRFTRPQ